MHRIMYRKNTEDGIESVQNKIKNKKNKKRRIIMKKKYPSQEKYERENPSITFRVPIDVKEKIDQLVETTGKSISQIMRETLFYAEKEYSEIFEQGHVEGLDVGINAGINRGKRKWAIWCYCNVCGKKIYIEPNSDVHNAIIKYMKEQGWGHAECHKSNKES